MLTEKKLIYKNTRDLEVLKRELGNMVMVLNQNYIKAMKFNPDLTPTIILYLSFMPEYSNNEYLNSKVYNLIKELLAEHNKYLTEDLVREYYKKVINSLLKCHLEVREIEGMIFIDEKPNAASLKANNLESIHGDIANYNNIEKYIVFDEKSKKYIVNESAINDFELSNTFYTQNSKQVKALKLLEDISNKFKELQEMDQDLDLFLFNRSTSQLEYDRTLAEILYKL